MALILENEPLQKDVYRLRLSGACAGRPGQFYMLTFPGTSAPFLPRPISICDEDKGVTTLCYAVVGRGTALLASMKAGQSLELSRPLGNGFPLCEGDATLIGGGLGAAPLLFLCRALRQSDPGRRITVHLGFRETPLLTEEFTKYTDGVTLNMGGFVTDDADFSKKSTFYACGPAPMLAAAAKKPRAGTLFVSLEARMACGTGACLGCSIETAHGNRRVCKDGPVFDATEIFYEK